MFATVYRDFTNRNLSLKLYLVVDLYRSCALGICLRGTDLFLGFK